MSLPYSANLTLRHISLILFLAEYHIPFMLVGLATNLIGIGVISFLILHQRRYLRVFDAG